VNIKVLDVETGIWARPYIETTDGKIYYGDPIYKNITEEATEKLKLKVANSHLTAYNKTTAANFAAGSATTYYPATLKSSVTNATVGDSKIQIGLNTDSGKYYFYSSMQKLDSNVKANVVQSGVVYDKFGLIDKYGKLVSDQNVTVEDALKLENGCDLTLDKNKGKRSIGIGIANTTSDKLSAQEYGANISADGMNGVWVRAYVKLSSTLVVYTDPVYIEGLSDHYRFGDAYGTALTSPKNIATNWEATKQVGTSCGFSFKISPVDGLTLKKAGVVADNSGEFLTYNSANKTYNFDADLAKKASAALILNNGYKTGSKTATQIKNNTYNGTYNPVDAGNGVTIPIVVRPFITFLAKDGKTEITVYGAPYAVQTASKTLTYGASKTEVDNQDYTDGTAAH
jgi:hypothetical protein